MIDRWCRAHSQLVASAAADASAGRAATDESRPAGPFERALGEFTDALCDDLNLARAIAALNGAVAHRSYSAQCVHRELASLVAMDSVLSVLGRNAPVAGAVGGEDPSFVGAVEALIARRAAARASKDWAESDRIRDELAALGVTVKDGPSGPTWSKS
jgi:cysteinyl-tRNA synthetase